MKGFDNVVVSADVLKAPFVYFGGKSKVADMVWERLGNPRNYVEPFMGSAAVLLRRPCLGTIETVNDLNCYVSNFWRAVKSDPEAVAHYADWIVSEVDMHARHKWLVFSSEAQQSLSSVRENPEYFDAKIAGWWVHGSCCWIGAGWCAEGVDWAQPPTVDCLGVNNKLTQGRVQLGDAFARGRGVNANDSVETCANRREWLTDWMQRLADRLRPVRVCCGHWQRVCSSYTTLTRLGLTGVFLDPPYRTSIDGQKNRDGNLYAHDKSQDINALCDEVQAWCLKWGSDPEVRIALCGYEGEYNLPGWECVEWKATGGYGNQSGAVNENAERERIWFSPACVKPKQEKQSTFLDD